MSTPIRDAGAIVLLRGNEPLEVFWVERSHQAAFLPGHRSFVGGRVERDDGELPLENAPEDPAQRRAATAALRELFEETGVLLARFNTPPTAVRLEQALIANREGRPFAELLQSLEARLDGSLLRPAGRWITPDFAPRRFDTHFFLADLPAGQEPVVKTRELASGEWIRPAEAVTCWQDARALVPPPVLHILEALEPGLDSGLEGRLFNPLGASGRATERIEFFPGVVLVPLKTNTLPPATHTNAYLVGKKRCVLIDPGTGDPAALAPLRQMIELLQGEGAQAEAILLTHHHPDHVAGTAAMQQLLGLPVWAHAETARRLQSEVRVERRLSDGERLELGAGYSLRVLHSPGHAPGHLCFLEERTGALLTGDNVVGLGTVLIDPPEGDMETYIGSLRRLATLPAEAIFGGHGPPLPRPAERITALIGHRRQRQQRVLEAVAAGRRKLDAITELAYRDETVPLELAGRQTLAHLLSLESVGEVVVGAGGYKLPSPGAKGPADGSR